MELWRLSRFSDLSGLGGLRLDARWHAAGQPVVYLAESVPGAILEVLVHLLEADSVPPDYKLLRIGTEAAAEDSDWVERILPHELPADWQMNPNVTQRIGSRWLAERRTAMLRIPSAVAPATFNVLLNPLHPEANRLHIVESLAFTWDQRLHAVIGRNAARRRRSSA